MRFGPVLALIVAIRLFAGGQQRPPDEYQVKAVFLYNFAKFVEWPAEVLAKPNDPLVICVLGEDPFGRALDDAVNGKKIGGRTLPIRRISDAREAKGCHMLFVSSSERKRVLSILAAAEPGVLTVGESGNATAETMVINFVLEDGKVHFSINLAAADREKLRISSKLLSLALAGKR